MLSPKSAVSIGSCYLDDPRDLLQFLRDDEEVVGVEVNRQQLERYLLDLGLACVEQLEVCGHLLHRGVELIDELVHFI